MAEISPPDCGGDSCPSPSPYNDKRQILFIDEEQSNEKIISLNTLKSEIKNIFYTELNLNKNV